MRVRFNVSNKLINIRLKYGYWKIVNVGINHVEKELKI